MKKIIFTLWFPILLCTACQDRIDNGPSVISVGATTISLSGLVGDTQDITVTCSMSWLIDQADKLPNWIKVEKVSDTKLILTITQTNATGSPRKATVSLKAANGNKVAITVTQVILMSVLIDQNLYDISSSNMASSLREGDAFTTTFTTSSTYTLPLSIQVSMGGTLLNSSDYTYNSITGVLTIDHVTGRLIITAIGVAIPVTSITISPSEELSMELGKTAGLTATVLPANAANKAFSWSSSNPDVVTIGASTGEIMSQGLGSAVIRATASDGSGIFDEKIITVCPNMVFVKEGTFTMGAATATYGPVAYPHQVTLSDYWIGKTAVTQGIWEAVMGTTYSGGTPQPNETGPNYPVYYISWEKIVGTAASGIGYTVRGMTYYQDGFCYRLSQKYNDGRKYRLPTEAEWEFAAREGSSTNNYDYSGSNTIDDVAWYSGNSTSFTTHIVGTKQANGLGIYDMSGNVCEWCWDLYNGQDYGLEPVENPTGASEGYEHAFRGGSWSSDAVYCSVTRRQYYPYYSAPKNFGFRLAL